MHSASVSSVKLHLAAARALGLDADGLLAQAGIATELLDDPENRVDLDMAIRLIGSIAAQAPVPSYGLWLGENFHPAKLNLTGYVVMNARDLRGALEVFCRYQQVIGDAFVWEMDSPVGGATRLSLRKVRLGPVAKIGQEWSPTALLTTARILTEHAIEPRLAEFSHSEPAWRGEYDRIYRCELGFDTENTALTFDDSDLGRAVQHANPQMAAQLQASAQRILDRLEVGHSTSRRVSTELTGLLAGDVPTVERVARSLAMSVRSLQAALQQEGTTFKQLLARTRQGIAEERLLDPALSLAEVSFLVGFSEPSAFSRAFKKWTKQTPGAYRDKGVR